MIAAARSKVSSGMRAQYDVADARALPEADNAVDAVIACKLLVHISDWRNAVLEILRVLKPGGCFVQLNDAIALENTVRTCRYRRYRTGIPI